MLIYECIYKKQIGIKCDYDKDNTCHDQSNPTDYFQLVETIIVIKLPQVARSAFVQQYENTGKCQNTNRIPDKH